MKRARFARLQRRRARCWLELIAEDVSPEAPVVDAEHPPQMRVVSLEVDEKTAACEFPRSRRGEGGDDRWIGF